MRVLVAEASGVPEVLAPEEAMQGGDEAHYRSVGRSALRCIAGALVGAEVAAPRRILDLPCLHGRVLRVLRQAFPAAALTACDLGRAGVDFCAAHFGATPVYSQPDFAHVQFEAPFDLIWCGSLLTHLDVRGWLGLFALLARALRPGGLAVVTFQGRWAAHRMQTGNSYGLSQSDVQAVLAAFEQDGFGYADYPVGTGYGISLSAPAWILRELGAWREFRVVALAERQWDCRQDVLAIERL